MRNRHSIREGRSLEGALVLTAVLTVALIGSIFVLTDVILPLFAQIDAAFELAKGAR